MKKTLLLVCALALCLTGSAQAYLEPDNIAGYPCVGGDGELKFNETAGGHATNKLEMLVGSAWPGTQYAPHIPPAADYPHVELIDPDQDYAYPCTDPPGVARILRLPTHDPCHWYGTAWGSGMHLNSQGYRLTSVHGNDNGSGQAWNTITRLDASGQKYKGHNVYTHSSSNTGSVVWAEDNDPCADLIFTGNFGGDERIARMDYNNNVLWTLGISEAGAPMTAEGGDWIDNYANDMEIGPDGLLYIKSRHHVARLDYTLPTHAERVASIEIVVDETVPFGDSTSFWEMDIGPDGKIYVAHDVAYWAGDPNIDEIRIYNSDGSLDQVLDETTTAPWPWNGSSLTIDMITVGPDKTIYAHVSGATGQVWRIEIPEPTTMLLLGLGSVALLRRKRS
jgi:hypothetical protein